MSNNGAEIENNKSEKSSEGQKSSEAFSSRAMDEVMTDYQTTSKSKSDTAKPASGTDGFEITGLSGTSERARPASDSQDGATRTGQRPRDTQEGSATGQPANDTQEATITGRPAKNTQEATITGRPPKDAQEGSATGQPASDTQESSRTEQNLVSRGESARTGIAHDATRKDIPETNRLSDLRGFGHKSEEKDFGRKTQEKDFGSKAQEKDFGSKAQEKDLSNKTQEQTNTSSDRAEDKKTELPDLGGDMHRELQWTEVFRGGVLGGRSLLSNDGFGNDDQRQHLTEAMQRIADLLPNGGLSATVDEINRRLESQNSDMRIEIDLARITGPNSIPVDVAGYPTSISIIRRGDARSQYLFGNYNKKR